MKRQVMTILTVAIASLITLVMSSTSLATEKKNLNNNQKMTPPPTSGSSDVKVESNQDSGYDANSIEEEEQLIEDGYQGDDGEGAMD